MGTSRPTRSPNPALRADLLACLALVAFCLAYFWPVFLGAALVPTDGVYFVDHAFAPFRPPSVTWPVNTTLVADQVYVLHPWRAFTAWSLDAGYVPLWNPYPACGQSFLGNNQSAVFNPTNFVLNLSLPAAPAQTIFLLSTLVGACLFSYGLTRSLGGLPTGSFLAGLTFGFGGFVFIWLGYPIAATAIWLPALLWITHRLALRPALPTAVLLALAIGWQFLSGHLSTSVQMLAFWAIFVGYEWFRYRQDRRPHWNRRFPALAALALVLGTGLGSAQLLPVRESFGLSSMREVGRSGRWVSEDSAENARKALLGDWWFVREIAKGEVALLLLPERHGNPAFGDYHGHPDYGNYAERSSYVGFLGLLALVTCLFRRPPPGYRRLFFLSAVIVFGILLHLPLLNGIIYLPIIRLTNPARLRFIFTLCAAVSLGLSLPAWCNPPAAASQAQRPRSPWPLAVLLALGLAGFAALTVPRLSPDWVSLSSYDRWLRLAKLLAPAALGIGASITLFLAARRSLTPYVAGLLLAVLALVDFGFFGARWHAVPSTTTLFPETPIIGAARDLAGDSRITGPPNVFAPNIATVYGLRDVRIYDPMCTGRFVRLVEGLTAADQARESNRRSAVKGQYDPCPVLDRLTGAGVAWRWEPSRGPWLERLPPAVPHAYLAPRVEAASGPESLSRLAEGADPRKVTFIEDAPESSVYPVGPLTPAEIISYQPHHVGIHLKASRRGWLVLTDTSYPGWRAALNGRPAPIFIANYTFRAVPVPAGEILVTFDYRPASYRIGLFLSLLSLLVCCALLSARLVHKERAVPRALRS